VCGIKRALSPDSSIELHAMAGNAAVADHACQS
jgi:hypothetical protein